MRKGPQRHEIDPTSERLGDRRNRQEVRRSGQEHPSGPGVVIDEHLDSEDERLSDPLDLVDDRGGSELVQKGLGIGGGRKTLSCDIERDVLAAKRLGHGAREGRLS